MAWHVEVQGGQKGFGSKFHSPKEGRSIQRPKRRQYNKKDENNSPNIVNSGNG